MRIRLLFVLLLAFSGLALAEDWSKDFNVGANPKLTVDTNDASIRVIAGTSSKISARVTTVGYKIGPTDVRISERQSGDAVDLSVRIPSYRMSFGNHSVRVEITVPVSTQLELRSGDGRLAVTGIHGPARLHTGDGTIEVRDFQGALNAHTGDGRVIAEGRFDDLQIETSDGSIEAEVRPGSKMNGRWLIRTGDGSLRLQLPRDFAADLDAHTGDGHINIDFPITVNGSSAGRDSTRGKLNGGGQTLELRSGDGSITVSRGSML